MRHRRRRSALRVLVMVRLLGWTGDGTRRRLDTARNAAIIPPSLSATPEAAARPRDSPELLSIIVPVYNEVRTVRAVLDRLVSIDLPLPREILVVDDGSTDGTGDLLTRRRARRPARHRHPLRAQRRQGACAAQRPGARARHHRRHPGRRPRARSGTARHAGAADRRRRDARRLRLAVPQRHATAAPGSRWPPIAS